MQAFVSFIFVTSPSSLVSCQSSGIKGTIIVRQHCGTPVGTPSLWIAPTHYVSNVTIHSSTVPVPWSQQHGGISQNMAHVQQSNSTAYLDSSGVSQTADGGLASLLASKSSRPSVSNNINQQTQTSNAADQSAQKPNTVNAASQMSTAASTTKTQSSCITPTATPISCPSSNGTTFTPAGSCIGGEDSYIIVCGTEYPGGGLTTLAGVDNTEQCINSCNGDPSCLAVAFDTTSGMCYERITVVFGNATAVPDLIFAFNARYIAAGGMYPSSGVEAVPTGLTKTLSSITSSSNLPRSATAGQAASPNPKPNSVALNSTAPSAGIATSLLSGQPPSSSTIDIGQSSTIAVSSSIQKTNPTGAGSLFTRRTSAESETQQSHVIPAAASQQSSLTSASVAATGPPSTTPTIPVSQACPQDTNQNIMVPQGTSWYVNCAQLYVGELIDTGTNATSSLAADDCLASCDRLGSGCVGFTYTDSTCMMYSRIDGIQSAAVNIVSARRYLLGSFSSGLTTFSASAESAASPSQGPSQEQSTTGYNPVSLSALGASRSGASNGLTTDFNSFSTPAASIGGSPITTSLSLSTLSSVAPRVTSNTIRFPSVTASEPNSNSQGAVSVGTATNPGSVTGSPNIPNPPPAAGSLTTGAVSSLTLTTPTTKTPISEGGLTSNSGLRTESTLLNPASPPISPPTSPAQSPSSSSASPTIQSVSSVLPTQAAPCPSANGQTYTDQTGTQYMIMCSTDTYPGNFAASLGISFDSCTEDCARQTEQRCVAVTYTNDTCFYKAQYENSYSVGNVQAAVRLNLVTGTRSTALAALTSQSLGASGNLTGSTALTSLGSSSTGFTNPVPASSTLTGSSPPNSGAPLSASPVTDINSAAASGTSGLSNSIPSSVVGSIGGNTLSASTDVASVGTLRPPSSTASALNNPGTSMGPAGSGLIPSNSIATSSTAGKLATEAALTQNIVGGAPNSASGSPSSMLSTTTSSSGPPVSSTSILSLGQGSFATSTQTLAGETSSIASQDSMSSQSPQTSASDSFYSTASSSSGPSQLVIGGPLSINPSDQSSVTSPSSAVSPGTSLSNSQSSSSAQSPTVPNTAANPTLLPSASTPLSISSSTISTNPTISANTISASASSDAPDAQSNSLSLTSSTIAGTSTQYHSLHTLTASSSISQIGTQTIRGSSQPSESVISTNSGRSIGPGGSSGSTFSSTTNILSGTSGLSSTSSLVVAPPGTTSTAVSSGASVDGVTSRNTSSISLTSASNSPLGGTSGPSTVSSSTGNSPGAFSSSQSISTPYSETAAVTDSLHLTASTASLSSISSSTSSSGSPASSMLTTKSQSVLMTVSNSVSSLSSTSSSAQSASITSSSSPLTTSVSSMSSSSIISPTTSFRSTTSSSASSTRTTCAAVPTAPSCPDGNQTIYQALDGSRFRLDCGIDYPGLDADAYAAVDLNKCFQICEARGPSCAGVSFVASFLTSLLSGYTCYFKTSMNYAAAVQQTYQTNSLVRLSVGSTLASGAAPVCPGANGQDYVGADGSRFRIHCNTDYPNNGLVQANASSFQVCIDSCDRAGILCAGVSYTPAGNGISAQPVCYLKSALGQAVNAVLGLVGGVVGSVNYDVHSAVRIGNPVFNNPPAYTCSAG